jgi:general secretion pathway protein L
MEVEAIARRWIDVLARLWLGWLGRRRARHWLKIVPDGDGLIVRQANGNEQVLGGVLSSGGCALPIEIVRAAQRSFVMLELAADEIISRRMTVPAQARDLLPGIVRNQIERMSPWRAAQASYGFDIQPSTDASNLDVRVLITSRAVLDEARGRVAALGLKIDAVVAGERAAVDPDVRVTLWSELADANGTILSRARRTTGALMVATVCITVALSVWAFMAAASAHAESEQIGAQIGTLQRQAKGTYSQQSIAALAPAERAWALKETSLVAAIVVEALSRALPDMAYLTELTIENTTVRIVGVAQDAPALIAPLEQSGQFKDVHFYAPTTRSADGVRFIFHIEARVEPHATIGG